MRRLRTVFGLLCLSLGLTLPLAALTITTGLLMVIGGFTRLGFFVNFFSRPVLVGYLNGIALSIIAGQLGKILGISVTQRDFGPSLLELAERLKETHLLSLTIGALTLALLVHISRRAPLAPVACGMVSLHATRCR